MSWSVSQHQGVKDDPIVEAKKLGFQLLRKLDIENSTLSKNTILTLIERGADLTLTNNGHPAFIKATYHASKTNDFDIVQAILDKGVSVDQRGGLERTSLMVAAEMSNTALITFLLDRGASVNLLDENKNSALHYAAINATPHVLDVLASRGADLHVKDRGDRSAVELAHIGQKPENAIHLINLKKKEICNRIDQGLKTPIRRPRFGGFKNQGGMR